MYDLDFILKVIETVECEKAENNNKILQSTNILTNNNIQTNINNNTNENIYSSPKNIYFSPKKISTVKISSHNESTNKFSNSNNKQSNQKMNSKYGIETPSIANNTARKINWIERQTVFQKKKKNDMDYEILKFSELELVKDKCSENKEDFVSKIIIYYFLP